MLVHSQVPKVEFTDGDDIKITVEITGLSEKKSVEISGYITQNNLAHNNGAQDNGGRGVFASFSQSRVVVEPDASGVAEISVVVPGDGLSLMADQPITVITRVSEIWPSVLTPDLRGEVGTFRQSWTINEAASTNWQLAQAAGTRAVASRGNYRQSSMT